MELSEPNKKDRILFLYRTGNIYAEHIEKSLIQNGYSFYRNNIEFVIKEERKPFITSSAEMGRKFIEKRNLLVRPFKVDDYEKCFDLWSRRIDRYSVRRHTITALHELEENENCLIVCDKNDELVAAAVFSTDKKIGLAENIAVAEQYNNSGIGGALLSIEFEKVFERGIKKHLLWIWDRNIESINMTRHFGVPTGRESRQFLMKV